MKTTQKYTLTTEQKLDTIKRWRQTGLLKELDESQETSVTAALEGQRLFNETMLDDSDLSRFKRMSIPIMRRLMVAAPNLEGSWSQCRYWHLLTTRYSPPRNFHNGHYNLDQEADWSVKLVEMMAKEIEELGPTKIWCYTKQDELLLINCENA